MYISAVSPGSQQENKTFSRRRPPARPDPHSAHFGQEHAERARGQWLPSPDLVSQRAQCSLCSCQGPELASLDVLGYRHEALEVGLLFLIGTGQPLQAEEIFPLEGLVDGLFLPLRKILART